MNVCLAKRAAPGARMARSRASYSAGISAAVLTAITLVAAAGAIDPGKSEVTATFRQMNAPVEGRFQSVRGIVDFNPKNPARAHARIEIDTASLDVGAPEYNDELRKKEWLDVATYPRASFVATRVRTLDKARFQATGKLTLKGKTQEISVAIAHRDDDGKQIYEGEFPISRKAFALGGADWDSTVADRVIVKFRIVSH